MRLWRVFPYVEGAAAGEPGGSLFRPGSGVGRFDNPKLYKLLYAAATPLAAIAESLAWQPVWTPDTFNAIVDEVVRPLALAQFEYEAPALSDLSSVAVLSELGVESVRLVVTRERLVTQTLAARLYSSGRYDGIAWWSFYDPTWTDVALWNLERVREVAAPEVITVDHPLVIETARALPRLIGTQRRGRLRPAR